MEATGYFDGACVTKPARIAGYGAVILDMNGNVMAELAKSIRRGTVNEAEYSGCRAAVIKAEALGVRILHLVGDSRVIVCQLTGEFACNTPELIALRNDVRARLKAFDAWDVSWVRRESNTYADALSKIGLQKAKLQYAAQPWE